jgi:hypothetical protein
MAKALRLRANILGAGELICDGQHRAGRCANVTLDAQFGGTPNIVKQSWCVIAHIFLGLGVLGIDAKQHNSFEILRFRFSLVIQINVMRV